MLTTSSFHTVAGYWVPHSHFLSVFTLTPSPHPHTPPSTFTHVTPPTPPTPLPLHTPPPQANRCYFPCDTEPLCGHWLLNQQTSSSCHQHSTAWTHLPGQDPCLHSASTQLAPRSRQECSDIQPQRPWEEGEHCPGVSSRRV